jgi:TPR repeat protein
MVKEVNTEDLMDLGYQAEEEGNVEKAIYYYKQAAAAGNTDG